jgi:hypothetical protein
MAFENELSPWDQHLDEEELDISDTAGGEAKYPPRQGTSEETISGKWLESDDIEEF